MAAIQATELVQSVNAEATHLGEFQSDLTEQDWSRDSACPDWTVADVAAHLSIAATWSDSVTRGIAADFNPPPGQAFLATDGKGSGLISQLAISYNQRVDNGLLHAFRSGYDRPNS